MRLNYVLDEQDQKRRASLGLIVLSVDETIEDDFRWLLPADSARLHHTRIESDPDLTAETIADMAARLPAAAALLPGDRVDAIGYACTSGATVLGEDRVTALIARAHPGVPATNPLTALKAACRSLGISRLGLVSPYVAEVSDHLRRALSEAGIETTAFGSFGEKRERRVARISPASVIEALLAVGQSPACEAVFASCTNLRAAETISRVETMLGKPVLASNQVLAWHMLRMAGNANLPAEAGRLARVPLVQACH